MKKLISALFFLLVLSALNAQNKDANVYLSVNSLDWIETAAVEFEELVSAIDEAYKEKNYNVASSKKGDLLKYTYKSVSTSMNLMNSVGKDGDAGVNEVETANLSKDQIKKSVEENGHSVGLALSVAEAQRLESYSQELLDLKYQIKNNDFEIHPGSELAPANIELLHKFADALSNTAQIYSQAKARS